ncbi:MAG: hypothetical protein JSW28_09880 [Thermoplasmata archaeon]|nr:MAG: hypothetical protein JSW28_09880 [Thermoplasmata archaeon]
MRAAKDLTEEEALKQLKHYKKVSFYLVGYLANILLMFFPLALLVDILFLPNAGFLYFFGFFGVYAIGMLINFNANKMSFRCWYPYSVHMSEKRILIYMSASAIVAAVLMNIVMFILFLESGLGIDVYINEFLWGPTLFGTIYLVALMMITILAVNRIQKKKIKENVGKDLKHFKGRKKDIISILENALGNRFLDYSQMRKEATFFSLGEVKYVVEKDNIEISVFTTNFVTISIGKITPSNEELVRKIQQEIDSVYEWKKKHGILGM